MQAVQPWRRPEARTLNIVERSVIVSLAILVLAIVVSVGGVLYEQNRLALAAAGMARAAAAAGGETPAADVQFLTVSATYGLPAGAQIDVLTDDGETGWHAIGDPPAYAPAVGASGSVHIMMRATYNITLPGIGSRVLVLTAGATASER